MRERREIYLDILGRGLLIIRNIAFHDPEQAQVEADHLHNLPELLAHSDEEELHDFYWNVMRQGYIKVSKPEWSETYADLWRELGEAREYEGPQLPAV